MYDHKIRFTEKFKRHFPLRLHMSLILLATFCSGLLATKLLLLIGMHNIAIRYPLAVIFGYAVFFLSIKLWFGYISTSPARRLDGNDAADALGNFDIPIGGGDCGGAIESFAGGGGQFSGAGASGSFDDMGVVNEGGAHLVASTTSDIISEGAGNVVGEAASAALGDDAGVVGILILAVLGIIVAIICGASIYMVYEAPFILSEAAFDLVLAASLVKSSRKMDDPDWIGSVFRTTWLPFAITLALTLAGAWLLHTNYPGMTRISELFAK